MSKSEHHTQPQEPVVRQPFKGPFTRWPKTSDTLLAGISLMFTWPMWNSDEASPTVTAVVPLLFIVGNGALIWRRRAPELVHGIVFLVSALCVLFSFSESPIFGLSISLYSIGRYSKDNNWSYIGMAAGVLLIAIVYLDDVSSISRLWFVVFLGFGFWYLGRRIGARGEYIKLLQERAHYFEQQQLAQANKAVAEERSRIARELHDIIAHQVSLMTVQAGAAKTIAEADTPSAIEAMANVESAGRQALDELRYLLNVLRPKHNADRLTPLPGLNDIPQLIADFEKAGPEVSFTVERAMVAVPARIGLTIYRIIQESLTNVLKHAGPTSNAEVTVTIDHHNATIRIVDDGQMTVTPSESGRGILGMQERVQQLGGSLIAEPIAAGGFQVLASIPLSEENH